MVAVGPGTTPLQGGTMNRANEFRARMASYVAVLSYAPSAMKEAGACVAAEMAARGVIACMQAMGAVGLLPHYGFGRLMTSARIAAYVDGTTEMQNERIGAALFKRYGGLP